MSAPVGGLAIKFFCDKLREQLLIVREWIAEIAVTTTATTDNRSLFF